MLNLREYRSSADRLADHLPWAALVDRGIVLNKDGSFQRTIRFRGPDLESATQAELHQGYVADHITFKDMRFTSFFAPDVWGRGWVVCRAVRL